MTATALSAARLADLIYDAIPITQLAFLKLLGLLEIELTDEVRTACVTVGTRSRLLLNPGFVEKMCPDDQDLVMLVLHELNHVLLGHTRIYETPTPARNFVFDAVINAHLCRSMPSPECTALFRRLYRADVFPEAILRPPENWRAGQETWALTGAALEAHQALYGVRSRRKRGDPAATYAELFELLEKAVQEGAPGLPGAEGQGGGLDFDQSRLLGNHGDRTGGPGGGQDADRDADLEADPDVLAAVRQIVAQWPALETCSGRDQGVDPSEFRLTPGQARAQAVRIIRAALIRVADRAAGADGPLLPSAAMAPGVLPYRTRPDRRAEVRAAFGVTQLLYGTRILTTATDRLSRVHLYLDVSGSMNQVLPLIYGALLPLQDRIHEKVHLFSTGVRDVTSARLASGAVLTDGGTDIACVTGHLIDHGVRRAVIITDGFVGPIPPGHLAQLRKRRVALEAVVTDGGMDAFAHELNARATTLPDLSTLGGSR